MSDLQTFCRQVRSRSNDHRKAIFLLNSADIPSQMISILRQELDSMIRVIYLLSMPDMKHREELIKSSVEGHEWKERDGKKRITDRKMVSLANKLQGWTESVYRFGCAFVHLSSFHDYKERDPMDMISVEEKRAILQHMRAYHGGPSKSNPKFADLVLYLPMVFIKIADNLECYIKQLEKREVIELKEL